MKCNCKKDKKKIKKKIEELKARLALYKKREEEILTGGVQAYGIGSRNISRYQTQLYEIRAAIKELEDEIASLEAQCCGTGARRAVAVVPMNW